MNFISSENKEKEVIISLPKNTQQYFYLDPISFFKNLVFDELFIVKDPQVIKDITKLFNKEYEINDLKLGIDFLSPFEVIILNYENQTLVLLRASLNSIDDFNTNSPELSIKSFSIEKKAYFLINGEIDIQTIKNYIKENNFEIKISPSNQEIMWAQFNKDKVYREIDLKFTTSEIIAKLKDSKIDVKQTKLLIPEGIHASFRVKELHSIFPNQDLLKNIEFVSLNYEGFKLEEDVIGVPMFSILMTFNRPQNCENYIDQIIEKYNLSLIKSSDYYSIGSQKLFFKQISNNEIYLSTKSQNGKIVNSDNNLKIVGDIKMITKIENLGLFGLILDQISIYKGCKNLFESTDKLSTKKTGDNTTEIYLSFKEGENVYHSLLKLFLLLSAE